MNKNHILLLSSLIVCTGKAMMEDLVVSPHMMRNWIENFVEIGALTTTEEIRDTINEYPEMKDAICESYKNEIKPQCLNLNDTIQSLIVEQSKDGEAKTFCIATSQEVSSWHHLEGQWKKTDYVKVDSPLISFSYARFLSDDRLMVGVHNKKNKYACVLFFKKNLCAPNPEEPWLGEQNVIIPVPGTVIAASFDPKERRCAISTQAWDKQPWDKDAYHIHLLQRTNKFLPQPHEMYEHKGTIAVDRRVEHLAWQDQCNLVMRNADWHRHVKWQEGTISKPSDEVSDALKDCVADKPFPSGWNYLKHGPCVVVGYPTPPVKVIARHLYQKYRGSLEQVKNNVSE